MFRDGPDGGGQCRGVNRQRGRPEGWAPDFSKGWSRPGRWPTRQASHPKLSCAWPIRLERKSEKSVCPVLQFRLLEKHEPNLRRADVRRFCERNRGTVENQCHQC